MFRSIYKLQASLFPSLFFLRSQYKNTIQPELVTANLNF